MGFRQKRSKCYVLRKVWLFFKAGSSSSWLVSDDHAGKGTLHFSATAVKLDHISSP